MISVNVCYCILKSNKIHPFLFTLSEDYYLVFVILKSRYHIQFMLQYHQSNSRCGELILHYFKTLHTISDFDPFLYLPSKSVHVFDCLDLVESWTVMPRAPSLLNQPRPHGVRQLLTCQQWTTPSSSQGAASLPLKPV